MTFGSLKVVVVVVSRQAVVPSIFGRNFQYNLVLERITATATLLRLMNFRKQEGLRGPALEC